MKRIILGLCVFVIGMQMSLAQKTSTSTQDEKLEIMELSKQKWRWMEEKKVDTLAAFFHDKSKFVHMSGTWGKTQEIDIIKTGSIWYKKADVHQAVVEIFDNTAILWNRITLLAVVRGNEVSNQFTATEVYKKERDGWKLLALTFSSVRPEHVIEEK